MRGWRLARDDGAPVQPFLYNVLVVHECEMLAPVFDSLFNLCEWASERPLGVGRGLAADEYLLLGLLKNPERANRRLTCASEVAHVLRCALHSTGIMMRLTLAERKPRKA
jgi:hypothetical protein